MEELNEKKSIYFVILIIILIILGIVLTIHFNNKKFVDLKEYDVQTTKKVKKDEITTTIKTTNQIKTTEKVVYLKKTSVEDVYTTYSESDINTNLVVSFTSNKKLSLNVKKYDINDALQTKNIISLYDINLYDNDKIVSIHDNNVTVKIPFNTSDYTYDYYKIAYLNDNNEILEYIEPTINDGYIIFNTTHLSKYAIVGFKNEIDLSKTTINISKNNSAISDYNNVLKMSKSDFLNVIVNTEYKDYKIMYSLRKNISIDNSTSSYQEFTSDLLSKVQDTKEYTLIIKIIVGDKEKVFQSIKFRVFDIIVTNEVVEKTKETKEIIGELNNDTNKVENEDIKYNYDDKEKNEDILIDTELPVKSDSKISNENNIAQETQIDKIESIVKVNGNIYVIDETDLSNLELTGYLIIETNENITLNSTTINNLFSIEITTSDNKFKINNEEYDYVINEDSSITITKENDAENNDLFKEFNILKYENNKIIFNKNNN